MQRFEDIQPHEEAQLQIMGTQLLGYRGSVAHGMYVPHTNTEGIDDIDLMSVYVAPAAFYFADEGQDVYERMVAHYDLVAYELKKFVGLLLKCNPNVTSFLWLPTSKYISMTPLGEELIANRKLFSSKAAYHSFSGYAWGQIKRMSAQHDDGTACCPGREFHDPGCQTAKQQGRGSQKRFATGFMGAKRKSLVEKYGYDCKNAAHALRLLRMGAEFLLTGEFFVDRRAVGDADELLAIKRGEWPLERVKETADALFLGLEAAREASTLPERPDEEQVRKLLTDLLCQHHMTEVAVRGNDVLLRRGRHKETP